jgi:hypothetical protein
VTGGPGMIKSQPMTESVAAGDVAATGDASTIPTKWEMVPNKRAGRMRVGNFIASAGLLVRGVGPDLLE